jgi:hypothetical protein
MTPEDIGRQRVREGIAHILREYGYSGLGRIATATLDQLDAENCAFAQAAQLPFFDAMAQHSSLTFEHWVRCGFMVTADCGYCFYELTAWWKEELVRYRQEERT